LSNVKKIETNAAKKVLDNQPTEEAQTSNADEADDDFGEFPEE